MLRRKLQRTGIWDWFKGKVKSLGAADAQLVQIRRVSLKLTKLCHHGLSLVCSSKQFKALELEKLRWRSKEQRSPPFISLVLVLVLLRNSKPIQIILVPNATYLVYLVNYFKDYVDIAASSRPIFETKNWFYGALKACSSALKITSLPRLLTEPGKTTGQPCGLALLQDCLRLLIHSVLFI